MSRGQMAQMGMLPLSAALLCVHRIILHIVDASLVGAQIHLIVQFIFVKLRDNGVCLHGIMDLVSHKDVTVSFFDFLRLKSVRLVRSSKFYHYYSKVQK